ncbi:hypothetical protein M406DRAFT_252258 [Cryphonectria parasitica EP155]|uniref:Uncharacterized protein n=1 Tax=Cryphonectria parasitica (strain ATCC 38755 / EP155) TaxID=660469 RepID=A0A9P4Y5W9_CRYP1|nr:uncharacterized protein M406DRAFT_252258 [Cryphonectria parasitica EP155]KAF3766947.1 hypothetical protein M406DRAFT_252258 [Cryphonectria parasitica EP155]
MSRTLLLCFIHGFKGNDDSFGHFPEDLKRTVSSELPDHRVESVVYPKYATKGELVEASGNFLEWLRGRVMEIRKAQTEKPWPPNDRQVGVILPLQALNTPHGFVASDALFQLLNERATADNPDTPLFPLIQGILSFDTPLNGLARSLFVYGAFSNYQKVSSVWNVMTALSAAPAGLGMALKRGARSLPGPVSRSTGAGAVAGPAAWKTWQMVAVRTGTVGAIAAGGVAAYVHREQLKEAAQKARTLRRQDLVDGYQQGVDRLGQGLAYVNRGNVGQSFAWLSDHFTFVGVLMKQQELGKRLERLAALQGVGVHDIYASMGENGYWSGGYFVPERTFCAVPAEDQPASNLFSRHVVKNAGDEIQAHMSMFQTDKNEDYQSMVDKAGKLVVTWFNDDSKIVDDPKITQPEPVGSPEDKIKATDEGVELEGQEEAIGEKTEAEGSAEDNELPDESPLDIAAAASLVPLPEDGQEVPGEEELKDKQSYMKYLMGIAQNAGTGVSQAGSSVKGYIPTKLPTISTPSMPSMPSMSMPKVSLFSKKEKPAVPSEDATAQAAGKQAQPQEQETESQAEGDEAVVVEKPVVAAAESTEKKEEEEEEKNVVAAKPESDTQGK